MLAIGLRGVVLAVSCFALAESVMNGTKALPGIYRWHSLFGGCSGSLLSSKVGITACHCAIKAGDEIIIMDRSMQIQRSMNAWRKEPWYTKVKQVKQGNPNGCSYEGNPFHGGDDYALFELEDEVPVCNDNRFGPLALMLPYLTSSGLNVSNLMRSGEHTQCVLVGYGAQSAESEAKQSRFRSVMMYRADWFEFDSEREGDERVFMRAQHTNSGVGDSGTPFVCIYDDVPYVTGILGGCSDVDDFGPDIQRHLEQLEVAAREMGVWDNIQDGQKKCGEYYKKYGVINDYINKIENCHYPKKPADKPFYETDWYVYPDVSAVDTVGMNRKIKFETENQCKK